MYCSQSFAVRDLLRTPIVSTMWTFTSCNIAF
jgi:hypothetical protein